MLQPDNRKQKTENRKPPKVAVLIGPTAVGKTAAALQLAQALGGEIVNADSLQVYRELDIGTAKPTWEERRQVRHHLVDVADPPEPYDAARFSLEGRAALADLAARQAPPLVAGGTGFYIKALLYGLFEEGAATYAVRARLQEEAQTRGLPELYQRLLRLDPDAAGRIHPHDTYRIVRALEVLEATGQKLSACWQGHAFRDCPYEVVKLGLALPREELYARIAQRIKAMLAQGWLGEVAGLLERYPADLKPLQAIGYRHLAQHLSGRYSLDEAVELLTRDTRRFAKRQLTWFRADPDIRWFHPAQTGEMLACLEEFFH
jgi:tRNA dimethylallyltransferase